LDGQDLESLLGISPDRVYWASVIKRDMPLANKAYDRLIELGYDENYFQGKVSEHPIAATLFERDILDEFISNHNKNQNH
jgi:hypothetical protein